MFVDKQIEIAKKLVDAGLLTKVYHSVFFVENETGKYASYRSGDEFYYVGADDRKGRYGYLREAGPTLVHRHELVSGTSKSYYLDATFRLVVFNDFEKEDRNEIIRRLIKFSFGHGIFLKAIHTDPFEVAKTETIKMDYNFGGNTLFISIEFVIRQLVNEGDCEGECIIYPNPIF